MAKDKINQPAENTPGMAETADMEGEIADLENQLETVRGRNTELAAENKKLKAENTELAAQVVKTKPRISIDGFVLSPDDPFAEGTMRYYLKLPGTKTGQPPMLPLALPYSDPNGRIAMENYIVRAAGAIDENASVRIKAARNELKKFVK